MNAVEELLHDVLRAAVSDERPRYDLASLAVARAEQIRRRRRASRAALGVSVVIGAGAAAAAVEDSGRSAVDTTPAASASAAAQRSGETDVRVVRKECLQPPPSASPGLDAASVTMPCVRHEMELRWPDGPPSMTATEGTGAPAGGSWPGTLVLELHDGTTISASPRVAGDGVWEYDVALPPRSHVRTFAFTGGT